MDWRNAREGYIIPTEYYSDQPYIVKADDGAWVCCMTTGAGHEGNKGQHIVTFRSLDFGATWIDAADVEPADGPEASYAVMLKADGGRIYVFYDHNTDRIKQVKADTKQGFYTRVDCCGHFVFKYSDDNGKTWSPERYDIPLRELDCDRNNNEGGAFKYFWNVGRAFRHGGRGYVPLIRVGRMGEGFYSKSEGSLLESDNILSERDPAKIVWRTLPDGDFGLRSPEGGGPISEEQSFVTLSDGSFYCVYRTVDGHPACSYSRDGGHSWSAPEYKKYADGRLFNHPRAANFVWKCENGKFLYWFNNNGTKSYDERNPAWVSGGVEGDSPDGKIILWSQPEILLYDDDTYIRMSYPDLVEDSGRYFVTETNKDDARVHEIPAAFLEKLWSVHGEPLLTTNGLLTEYSRGAKPAMPVLPGFTTRDNSSAFYGKKDLRSGFTLEFIYTHEACSAVRLLNTKTAAGKGLTVDVNADGSVTFAMCDGRSESVWTSRRKPENSDLSHPRHLGIVVDGGPKIITFIADGTFDDGGGEKPFGWGRFNPDMYEVNGLKDAAVDGCVNTMRIYGRALMTSEVINNYRA